MKIKYRSGGMGANGFPSLDGISIHELRRRIAAFKRIDFASMPLEQVKSRLGRLLDGYPFSLSDLNIYGTFRVRKNPTPGVTLGHVRELWYPPAAAVKEPGRVNDAGQPRFYSASAPHTAMFEARAMPGDTVTLLWSKTRKDFARLNVAFLGVTRSLDPYIQSTRDEQALATQKRMALGNANYAKFRLIDEMLTELMTEIVTDVIRYKPTVALGHMLLDEAGCHAIQYPSVSTALKGTNMVMTTEKADELFVADEAWEFHCLGMYEQKSWEKPLLGMTPVRRSGLITPEGQIFWRQPGDGVTNNEWGEWAGIKEEIVDAEDVPKPVA